MEYQQRQSRYNQVITSKTIERSNSVTTSNDNKNEQQTKPKSTVTSSNENTKTQIINNLEYVFVRDVRETEKIKNLEEQNKKLNDLIQQSANNSTLVDLAEATTTKIKIKKPKCDICNQELSLSFQLALKHMDQCNELNSLFNNEEK